MKIFEKKKKKSERFLSFHRQSKQLPRDKIIYFMMNRLNLGF